MTEPTSHDLVLAAAYAQGYGDSINHDFLRGYTYCQAEVTPEEYIDAYREGWTSAIRDEETYLATETYVADHHLPCRCDQ